MHIVFVNLIIEYYSPQNGGAISTWMMQQARRLEERGHRVSILTRTGDSPVYDVGEVVPIDIRERHQIAKPRRFWSRLLQNLNHWDWPYYDFYIRSVMAELKRLQPDAVVCFNDLRIPSYVRKALPNAKVWVRLSNEVATQQPRNAFDRALDGYFPVSGYIRQWMQQRYGVGHDKSVVIVNGCDPEAFCPGVGTTRPDAERPMKVLYVGRINEEKGPDLVVDAVKQIRHTGRLIDLTVVGSTWWNNDAQAASDPYFARLSRLMDEAQVTHMGHVVREEIPGLYQQHDVVVIPSRWQEPCPQVLLESMASGCAVVASDRGGIPEAMGGAGILFDPDQPGLVQDALQRLLDNPALLERMKKQSRIQAQLRSWDRVTDLVEAALLGQPIPEDPGAHHPHPQLVGASE